MKLIALLAVCNCASAATCESLADLKLPNTTITAARRIEAGAFTGPNGQPMRNLPAFCRVEGVIKPTDDSNIKFEVWLPGFGWNGKFRGTGNGGFAGTIDIAGLAAAVTAGYAAASTDTGHAGSAVDATWALGHPEKIVDFGWRAIHETAEKGKAVTAAMYGEAPKRSYFQGCSNGGRQALMEAQRFPADYDGIIAGAPANYWTHLLTKAIWDVQALSSDGAFIPPTKIPAIENAAIAACDAMDGVKDGIIDDPSSCRFDPAVLLCKEGDSDSCLTTAQVGALRKILAGPSNSKGDHLFPGSSIGGAPGGGGWSTWLLGPTVGRSLGATFGRGFYGSMVFGKGDWDYRTMNFDSDVKTADEKFASVLNATDPDLKRFRDRGGKLILYHGWSDPGIPPQNAIDYYRSVVAKMGGSKAGEFARLFMVPGMQHCGDGPGPNVFNMAPALERWVEENVAPDRVIARKDQRTRPLCPYPLTAKWTGSGSTDDAANFVCK